MAFCRTLLLFGVSLIQLSEVRSQPIHCSWGQWTSWSVCDPCSKTQTQVRSISVYPQFGGHRCSDTGLRTQLCVSAQACPLEEGCGERFRCSSGKCVSQALVCNGDVDCEEDGRDEQGCDTAGVCDLQKPPPQIELTGLGFDAVRGELKGLVINTKSFGGQCRKIFSGDHMDMYRLPQSLLRYSFMVTAKNDFSSEFYQSTWHYLEKVQNRESTKGTTSGHSHFTSHDELKTSNMRQLVVISSDVEVAQFQNQPAEYLPLSEEFWKVLSSLPVVYNYGAYRRVLERFGTHYLSEGTLGGRFNALLHLTQNFIQKIKYSIIDQHECVRQTHTVLFFIRWTTTRCNTYYKLLKDEADNYARYNTDRMIKVNTVGGYPTFISALNNLDLNTAEQNGNRFSQWAGSVKILPTLITQKIRPLYELVKEVSCAGLKKHHLKRALETYLSEEDSCRCQPCRNNGLSVLRDGECLCVCKPGTSGLACEKGTPVDEQPGVIDGAWACWSAWSSCSSGRQTRSRSCSRPAPQNGKSCSGNAVETASCEEEEELEYLRSMEPHCFDQSSEPRKSCRNPPHLPNGFVLHPKDVYSVGSKIEYSCIDGYYLRGNPIAECTEEETWRRSAMECKSTSCGPPLLPPHVTGSPWKPSYRIGESVLLSCPAGDSEISGPAEIQCNSGLSWSPQIDNVKCQTVATAPPVAQCQPWENRAKEQCVCKVPHQCGPSLEVCAKSPTGRTSRVSVCKVRAQQCLGQLYSVAEHSACKWPEPAAAVCPDCSLWTMCDDQTKTCRCKTLEECSPLQRWVQMCVRLNGDSPPSTVTECEVGVRQCQGETPHVVSLEPCKD